MRTITILLIISSIFLAACGGRNPNLSKKQLEEMMADSIKKENEKQDDKALLPDTSYVPPAGAKYTENRSVDPSSLPVVLKVAIPQGEKTTLKLSDIGKSVQYITLTLPNEADFFLSETSVHIVADDWAQSMGQSTSVRKIGDFYITDDILAVRVFDKNGAFIRNLVESEFDGERTVEKVEISANGFKRGFVQGYLGNTCYLAKASKKELFCGTYNLNTKELVMAPAKRTLGGSFVDKNTVFNFRGGYGSFMALSLSPKGDTLCKFNNYLPMPEKLGGKTLANSDQSFHYLSSEKLFFRQAYCDTIFRVESASRIVPAFCFDFGGKKASLEDGLRGNTAGKLIPWEIKNIKEKIILLFTEGRDCPNCRTKGAVKFYGTMYDKRSGQSTPLNVPIDAPESMVIANDIDGGLPVLVCSMNVPYNYNMADNYLVASFTKKQIIDVLKSKSIPAAMADKLNAQAEALTKNQMLVMIVEMK